MPLSKHYNHEPELYTVRVTGKVTLREILAFSATYHTDQEFAQARRVLVDMIGFNMPFESQVVPHQVEHLRRHGSFARLAKDKQVAFVCPPGWRRGGVLLYLKATGLRAGLFSDVPTALTWLESGQHAPATGLPPELLPVLGAWALSGVVYRKAALLLGHAVLSEPTVTELLERL